MNRYLTLKKVLIDSVALYRAHFLYITVLVSAVIIPYSFIITRESLPGFITLFVPIFLLLIMMVEIVSKKIAASSYIYINFVLVDEIKLSLKKVLPFTLISFLGAALSLLGFSFFVIPGVIVIVFFNLLKVKFVVDEKNIKNSITELVQLLKGRNFIQVIKINMFPITLQFLFSIITNPMIKMETLESDIMRLFPYIIGLFIILFPISISFYTSLYYNLVKENQIKDDQLKPTN